MKRGFLNTKKAKDAMVALTPALPEPIKKPVTETAHAIGSDPGVVKLSHGVVKDAGPPADYDPNKFVYYPVAGSYVTSSTAEQQKGINYIVTTLPPLPPLGRDPDGHTECMIEPVVKQMALKYPGFPRTLPRPKLPLPYVVKKAPGMGLGLYAARDIKAGELIIAERPLILAPILMRSSRYAFDPATVTEHQRQLLLAEKEQELGLVFNRLTPENQVAFKALANCHLHDGSGPLMGVIRTNSFGVWDYQTPEDARKRSNNGIYAAVTKTLSRANHSCEPNTGRKFDAVTFSMQARADRNISKGEALTVAYCPPANSYKERQEELAGFGFVCECAKCRRERP